MADNVDITPGAGATIATDDIGGAQHQLIKVVLGADGVSNGPLSASNPMPVIGYGELVEVLEAMRTTLHSISRNIGQAYPDAAGRLRVAIDSISAAQTLATVTSVTTVANQTNIGGFAAVDKMPSLMHGAAESLRRNISVT